MALPLNSPKFIRSEQFQAHTFLQRIANNNSVLFYEVIITLALKIEYLREKIKGQLICDHKCKILNKMLTNQAHQIWHNIKKLTNLYFSLVISLLHF